MAASWPPWVTVMGVPSGICMVSGAGSEGAGAGARYFKPLGQVIESINDTFKGQLDLERHGGRTTEGVYARITQRLLAMAVCIWHNDNVGQSVKRSLLAYDH